MNWKEIDKEQPPFDTPVLLINPKVNGGKYPKVGYLKSITSSGYRFVDEDNENLDRPGSMINPHGNPFKPTHWCLIELP